MPIIECLNCKISFNCENKRINRARKINGKLFCSKECDKKYKSTLFETNCSNCGKAIFKTGGDVRKAKTGNLYCSKSCAASSLNKMRSGENHPSYINGSATYRDRKLRSVKNPACEDCGIDIICVLEVHHIDRDRTNNSLENLEILCANCHLMKHCKSKYNNGGR